MNDSLKYKNIVIWAGAGIGDFIWVTSALSLIKNCDKQIKITLITFDIYLPLVDTSLRIDKFIIIKHNFFNSNKCIIRWSYKIFWCLINYFNIHKYDNFLFLDQSSFVALTAKYFYRVKNIIGPATTWYGINIKNPDIKYYTKIIPMPIDSNRVHSSIRYQLIIRSIFKTYNLSIPILPDTSYLSTKVKNIIGETKKYKIAICLRGYVKWRYWDLKYCQEVIETLNKITDVTFFIIGNRQEEIDDANNLKTNIPNTDIRNICGKTTLLELREFFKSIDLLISVDTGAIHIASTVNTPVISLHGTTLPEQSRAMNYKSIALCSYRNCAPCNDKIGLYNKICSNLECMYDITPDKVLNEVKKILKY